jgi:hypothetical protein
MDKRKNLLLIFASVLILIASSFFVSSAEWTQYPNSFTSSSFTKVRTTNTYSMAIAGDLKIFLYNGSIWGEISAPSGVSAGLTLKSFDKSSNYKFYFYYLNASRNTYEIWKYTPSSSMSCPTCWSLADSGAGTELHTNLLSFACNQKGNGLTGTTNDAECYILNGTGAFNTVGNKYLTAVVDAVAISSPVSCYGNSVAGYAGKLSIDYDYPYVTCGDEVTTGQYAVVYKYNGVSWQSISVGSLLSIAPLYVSSIDANVQNIFSSSQDLRYYNSSSGSYGIYFGTFGSGIGSDLVPSKFLPDGSADFFWVNDATPARIYKHSYFSQTNKGTNISSETVSFNAGVTITDMDFDDYTPTGKGWASGASGMMYSWQNPIAGGTYTVSSLIYPNPTNYGSQVAFSMTVNNADNELSTVYARIYSDSTSVSPLETHSISGVGSGVTAIPVVLDAGSTDWNNYLQLHAYTVRFNAVDASGHSSNTETITWNVLLSNATYTANYTTYSVTPYVHLEGNFSNINSVLTIGENDGYATATNDSNNQVYILSYDSANPNSLLKKSLMVVDNSGISIPTSLGMGTDKLYLGTDNEIYEFTNSSTANANGLVQNQTTTDFGLLSADYVYDLTGFDDSIAWVCRKGTTTDDLRFYNSTTKSASTTISNTNPCKSVLKDGNTIIISKGSSGIRLYDANSHALLSTVTSGINNAPSGAYHDRLSTSGNFLFAITGANRITKYDITDTSNPVKVDDCTSSVGDLVSLEAINNNEVIIGTNHPSLRVCDFNNTETFNFDTNVYESQILFNQVEDGLYPYEISLMDSNGKIQVAESKAYSIYFYSKNNLQTNHTGLTYAQPIVTRFSNSNSAPCINETVLFEVTAIDPQGQDLVYDWDCEGTKTGMTSSLLGLKTFSCKYTITGGRYAKSWVKNQNPTPILSTSFVDVQNCVASLQLNFKTIDLNTGANIPSVTVTVDGIGNGLTDSQGNINFTVPTSQSYTVTFSKDGYFEKVGTATPTVTRIQVPLEPTTDANGEAVTTLTIQILDSKTNLPISGAIGSALNTITGETKYAISDVNGNAFITKMFTGQQLLLGASKDNYVTNNAYIDVAGFEQKTVTIKLTKKNAIGQTIGNDRGCVDTIEGVILCSPLNISLTGDKCVSNSDCLTDECVPHLGAVGTCANFNWSLCDRDNRQRNDACFRSYIAGETADGITNWMLDNFLYVLMMFVFLMVFVIIMASFRRR